MPAAQARRLAREWRERADRLRQELRFTRELSETLADAWPWYQAHTHYSIEDAKLESLVIGLTRKGYKHILTTIRTLDRKLQAYRADDGSDLNRWMDDLRGALQVAEAEIHPVLAADLRREKKPDAAKARVVRGIRDALHRADPTASLETLQEVLEIVFDQKDAGGLVRSLPAESRRGSRTRRNRRV